MTQPPQGFRSWWSAASRRKTRQKLIADGAEDDIEKNSLMPVRGINLLPKMLENIICHIQRKRGIAFSSVPMHE